MPEPGETGKLTVIANRGGTIQEISGLLNDLEAAYLSLYQLESLWPLSWSRQRGSERR